MNKKIFFENNRHINFKRKEEKNGKFKSSRITKFTSLNWGTRHIIPQIKHICILESTKASLTTYQGVISEAENMQLRQTIQQIRNNDETFQYELFKVAELKGYYTPAGQAPQTEVDKVKNEVSK